MDYSRDNYCDASDLNLYYDPEHPIGPFVPDWMLSVGVPWLYGGQDLRYFKLVAGRYQEQPLAPQPPLIWLPDL